MISRRTPLTSALAALALIVAAALSAAPAQADDENTQFGPAKSNKKMAAAGGGGDWAKATKDSKIRDGLFRIYEGKSTWHLQLNPDQMDKQYIMAMTIGRGVGSNFILGGLTLQENMVRFKREGDKVFLYKDDLRFRAPGNDALKKALELSFGPSVAHSFKVAAENKDTLLIDMGDLLISDYVDMLEPLKNALGGPARLDEKRSTLGKLMVFPKNVEMEAMLTVSPTSRERGVVRTVADTRYLPITIRYSLMEPPPPGFVPRLADDRVGYFTTDHKDFTRDGEESYMVHFANRWRLEKKDPTARLSEPKQPIVFYLENTIPEEYRPAVRAGIEEWNKAFEAAGFKNAIVAKDQPDDSTFDAADIRYATIRWISSSELSFGAIGPSRIDPRTGEIFDGDILIEAGIILGLKNQYRRWIGSETIEEALDGISRADLAKGFSPLTCRYGMGAMENGGLVNLSALLEGSMPPGSPVPGDWLDQFIKNLTMHEVGHSIGLRHNFQSSVAIPADKLGDQSYVEKYGMLGSVMDYDTPYLEKSNGSKHHFWSPTLGAYDIWAIRYGYTPSVAQDPYAEQDFVARIAAESTKPGHEYGTDEDTYTLDCLDPRNNIYDQGHDPLAFGQRRTRFVSQMWSTPGYEKRVLAEGTGYQTLRNSLNLLIVQYARGLSHGLKYVGGQYVSRAHYGDPNSGDPFTPVEAAKQREALRFLTEQALSPTAFDVPANLLNKAMANRDWDWENNLFSGGRIDYPFYATVLAFQTGIVDRLMEPQRLARVREVETRQVNALSLAELFNELTGAIWGEFGVGAATAPARQNSASTMTHTSGTSTRRDLQRHYVDNLSNWVVNPAPTGTDDARALARLHLTRIDDACARSLVSASPKNDVLRAHLLETRARIKRALEAEKQAG